MDLKQTQSLSCQANQSEESGDALATGDACRWRIFLAAGLIALATVAAFSNSFAGPFIFDDTASIPDNATIRHLWPLSEALSPPNLGQTVTGRPLLNLSLAVNYAIGGLHVWGYHAMNLAIHLLGSLLLFGVLRRTFLWPAMRGRWGTAATPLACVIALLWAIHPLQTESVTYVVQRAESLVGLFYLLTLYCFVRGVESTRSLVWYSAVALSCLLGMASKEVMVSAPLMVLLYDRTFVAGSFREAWQRRGRLYMALAGTWLLLGCLVLATRGRGGTAGLGIGITWQAYLRTQYGAIVHYLRLCVWPHPLLFDHGLDTAHGILKTVPYAIVVELLGLATVVALWRWPKAGFLGAWFFAILAPTSSVVPVASQTVAEHRMYLPLAAVLTALVVGGYLLAQRLLHGGTISRRASQVLGGGLALSAVLALGTVTYHRNADYRSALSIWQDTVAKAPANARAQADLAIALADCGQSDDAMVHYQKAIALRPDFAFAHDHFGILLARRGQVDEAIAHFKKAIEIYSEYPDAHNQLGLALAGRGQFDDAIAHYKKAIDIKPDFALAHNNLGVALAARGQIDDAMAHYKKALALQPNYVEAENNYGVALAGRGQLDDAIAHYKKAIEIKPDYPLAYNQFGIALAARGQIDDAMAQYKKAIEIKPDYPDPHYNLGLLLAGRGQTAEAIAQYRKVLDIAPDNAYACNRLAKIFATCPEASFRNGAEAIALARRAVKLSGGREPAALDTLAAAYAEAGRFSEAAETAGKAFDLATQQKKQTLAASIKAKRQLYEAKTPYREPPSAPSRTTARP